MKYKTMKNKINPKMLLTKEECHNKRYYEKGRNGWTPTSTADCCINPKMMLSKDELIAKHYPLLADKEFEEDKRIPSYYRGKNGYEARKVVDNFDLSYNVGTCVTYLLRCGKKTEEGMDIRDKHIEDIQKGVNHLLFEIERLKG